MLFVVFGTRPGQPAQPRRDGKNRGHPQKQSARQIRDGACSFPGPAAQDEGSASRKGRWRQSESIAHAGSPQRDCQVLTGKAEM